MIGQSLRRLEDERFLSGHSRYVADINLPRQTWMQVVRSPHAHATIRRIALDGARAVPGVLGVFTASDLADLGPLPCIVPVASVRPMISPLRFALTHDRVRHVGDPLAFVVAETRDAARTAAETVGVDYVTLPAITKTATALNPGAPLVWDVAPDNISYQFQKGDAAAVKSALATAAHVVELEIGRASCRERVLRLV